MDRRLSRWRPLVSGLAGFGIAIGLCILMHEGAQQRCKEASALLVHCWTCVGFASCGVFVAGG